MPLQRGCATAPHPDVVTAAAQHAAARWRKAADDCLARALLIGEHPTATPLGVPSSVLDADSATANVHAAAAGWRRGSANRTTA